MSFREIDIDDIAPVAPRDPGAVPELRWLPVQDMVIDDTYQRPLGRSNRLAIRQIASEFSWGKFSPVLAAPIVGGRYAIIDGQHRVHAAVLAGHDMVPAMLVPLSERDQAAAFASVNGNVTAMTPFHVLRAALAAEEPWAIEARAAVEAAGCSLRVANASTAWKKPREVYAVSTVLGHVKAGRARVITRGLGAMVESGIHDTAEHWSARVLVPWLTVLAGGGDAALSADLARFCAMHDLLQIRDGCEGLVKRPEYLGLTAREITSRAISALLKRFLEQRGAQQRLAAPARALPAPDRGAELIARMSAVAKAENEARRRAT